MQEIFSPAISAIEIERMHDRVYSAAQLETRGITPKKLQMQLLQGKLQRVAPGRYANSEYVDSLSSEARHIFYMVAEAIRKREHPQSHINRMRAEGGDMQHAGPVFAGLSAATLMGLPVWGHWHAGATNPLYEVHMASVCSCLKYMPRARGVARCLITPDALVCSRGFVFTGLPHTIRTLFATRHFMLGFAVLEFALHKISRQAQGSAGVDWLLRQLEGGMQEHPSAKGNRALRLALAIAGSESESVLESYTKLRLAQLGIEYVMQQEVRGSDSRHYRVDFFLPKLGVFLECDGRMKYWLTEGEAAGSEPHSLHRLRLGERRIMQEKLRADAISNATGLRVIRCSARDVASREAFLRWVRGCGLPVMKPAHSQFGRYSRELLRSLL